MLIKVQDDISETVHIISKSTVIHLQITTEITIKVIKNQNQNNKRIHLLERMEITIQFQCQQHTLSKD